MRRLAVVVALCALTTGCTVTTGGKVVPAPTLGHVPPLVSSTALDGLLLDPGVLDTIMGASGLTVVNSSDKMYANHTPTDECLVTWVNVHEDVYAGSGWTGLSKETVQESATDYEHIVYQSVVSFPEALDAHDQYVSQVAGWAKCDNKQINERNTDDPEDRDNYWKVGESQEKDGVLTITRSPVGGDGWSCQRALTSANNVVVDIDVCADNVSDQAAQVAKKIAEKINEKQ